VQSRRELGIGDMVTSLEDADVTLIDDNKKEKGKNSKKGNKPTKAKKASKEEKLEDEEEEVTEKSVSALITSHPENVRYLSMYTNLFCTCEHVTGGME
jgi:hypothetical protein